MLPDVRIFAMGFYNGSDVIGIPETFLL
jgi:hypothetical protein